MQRSAQVSVSRIPLLFVYTVGLSWLTHQLSPRGARQFHSLERFSRTDALVHVPSRAHFEARLSEELRRSKRGGNASSVLMIDVDRSKSFND